MIVAGLDARENYQIVILKRSRANAIVVEGRVGAL
jgi:hypothetical protein